MVFEQLNIQINRILEYRREGTQRFDFTVDKMVQCVINGSRGIGWRDPDIPSYKLFVDRKDGVSIAQNYLSYVEIQRDHPISESLVNAFQQGHTIRFKGKYDLNRSSDSISLLILGIPWSRPLVIDSYRGQIAIEDRSTRQEIQTFDTAFEYWYGEYIGYLFGRQPIVKFPPVAVDKGIGYQMLQAGLDPAEHPVDEASDYLMVLSCGHCSTGKLYSQPRINDTPKDVSLSCDTCGSRDLTTLYQNF